MAKRKRTWDEHVRSWRASGLTAQAYADSEGLRTWTLYSWSTRLNRSERPAAAARFIEVPDPGPTSRRGLEVRVGEEVVVTVEPGFDPQLLRDVVAALVAR